MNNIPDYVIIKYIFLKLSQLKRKKAKNEIFRFTAGFDRCNEST